MEMARKTLSSPRMSYFQLKELSELKKKVLSTVIFIASHFFFFIHTKKTPQNIYLESLKCFFTQKLLVYLVANHIYNIIFSSFN